MGSKGVAAIAFVLCVNLVLLSMVRSTNVGKCPIDALKLGVCANVLDLVKVQIGSPPTLPCCNLIKDIADLEAAACLCTAIKANVLNTKLDFPLALTIILNNCAKKNSAFQCA